MKTMIKKVLILSLIQAVSLNAVAETWGIETAKDWKNATKHSNNVSFQGDTAVMANEPANYQSIIKRYPDKRTAKSITFEQTHEWRSWTPVSEVGPVNLKSAPVFLTKGPNDYWLFGRYDKTLNDPNFKAKKTTLPGYDIPLFTTSLPNQFDSQGGLKAPLGGYHAWQSSDMKTWVHHGPVTEWFSRWVTSAEYVDGKTYIYYDYPNDQNPHVYIDEDLTDGVPGKNMGMIFNDPSHGSDTVFFRESDGSMHVIYEDWTPVDAEMRAWDSPLAGHAVSKNGFDDFTILPPAVDLRTTPTGKTKSYKHPHWASHPAWDTDIGEYQEHSPAQDAFGDWCMIKIGGQYYLFGDYDKAEHAPNNVKERQAAEAKMSIARFTSDSLDKEFDLLGDFGETGHPDPDIGFAEGLFYLITQAKDFVSTGPWVDTVTVRVGVDINNDGKIDQWTDWQKVTEQYKHKKGFAKHVERIPAQLDVSHLPEGYGFGFEFKTTVDENGIAPAINKINLILQ